MPKTGSFPVNLIFQPVSKSSFCFFILLKRNRIDLNLPSGCSHSLLELAVNALADEERRVVMLHAVAGLKHREIADLLEMPLATVLSKYHRALKKLNNRLKGDGAQ